MKEVALAVRRGPERRAARRTLLPIQPGSQTTRNRDAPPGPCGGAALYSCDLNGFGVPFVGEQLEDSNRPASRAPEGARRWQLRDGC